MRTGAVMPNRIKFVRVVAGAAFLLASSAALADEDTTADTSHEGGTLSILFENDIFYHTDRDYTNGVLLGWTSAPDASWDFATNTARLLPFFQQEGVTRTSYTLGQNIYTPSNLKLFPPDPTDRPYAGFLYFGLGVADETDSQLDQAQLQIGMVGPASLAEESQKFVHRIIHDTIPAGWSFQLHNEPAFVLIDEKSWRAIASGRLLGFSFDIDPHVGAAVGTVYDFVNAGAMARFGLNLPDDYGPLRIEPALPGTDFFEPTGAIGAYLFAGVDGRAIARNIFLDGNTWQNSPHVSKIPYVGDLQLGAALTFRAFRLSFTHVIRTKEFTTQHKADQFGAINLSVRF